MDRLILDLRFALRQLARSPGFTAAAVLVLGVGIGGSTAIFGAVDNILFRPLDLPDSDRLVWLCEDHPRETCFGVSPPNAEAWAERAETLDAVGLGRGTSFRMATADGTQGVYGGLATPGLFRALAVSPARGRLLRDEDMLPLGAGRVAVVSHGFWQTELGGSELPGATLTLNGEPYAVVGVLPEGVDVPHLEGVRVWTPLQFDPSAEEFRDWRGFHGYGRLAAAASVMDAESELGRIQASLAETYPESVRGWGARVTTMKDRLVGPARPLLLLFLGAVALVLLIVSVNLAGLLLARATTRERELAVRVALGADRAVVARQLAVEAGMLAVLGAVAGAVVALWTTDAFVALAPSDVPRIDEVGVDLRVLAFAVAVSFGSATLFGLAPVLRLRSFNAAAALKDARGGGRGRRETRLRRALVVTELSLALVLVLSAGLLLRSFGTLAAWDPGFEYDRLFTFQLYPYQAGYEDEALAAFYRGARERFEAIPGVEVVGSASAGPLFGGSDGATPFLVVGQPEPPLQDAPRVRWYDAGPGYFPTLGVEIMEGRNIREDDRYGSTPVALVNQTMAREHWPAGSPVGALLVLPQWTTQVEVVGVVPDFRPFLPEEAVEPAIYVSNRQYLRGASFFLLRIAGDGDPTEVAAVVRSAVTELEPQISPVSMMTLEERLAGRLRGPRFNALLVALFAIIALVLGAAGIYGVMAYAVALRSREIGIRMALGAARQEVLRSILSEGLRLTAAGLVFGLAGAVFFIRLLRGLLHGVSAADPWTFIGTIVVLGLAALAATVMPALRASRTDPVQALRSE